MNSLATQRDKVKRMQNKLVSCLSFVRESLWTGSPEEVMTMKEGLMNQIKKMTDNLKPDMLLPCEHANVKVMLSPEVAQIIQQFGEVYLQCLKTDKGLEVAEIDDVATAVVHLPCLEGKRSTRPVKTLSCEQVSEIPKTKDYSVKKAEAIMLRTVIEELEMPYGVAINKRGDVIVADGDGHCVSIFNPTGEKLWSFGSQGSGNGQFQYPRGVALDDDDNILVVDKANNRIQQFTSDGKFIRTAGEHGSKSLEFKSPRGISVHPQNKKVYVADSDNHRIQILNSDLTFSGSFGSRGNDDGQFKYPWDIAFDSIGNALVVDGHNHRILVFSAKGKYLKKFGEKGSGKGELNMPSSISIDSDNVVYVTDMGNSRVSIFTHNGKFLTSFGSEGSERGQFDYARGIAVDENRVIYVSDKGRLQLFKHTDVNYIV